LESSKQQGTQVLNNTTLSKLRSLCGRKSNPGIKFYLSRKYTCIDDREMQQNAEKNII
jgi:hypothetical protein